MVLYKISDIGYSNVIRSFRDTNDRYTWSEDEILKYWGGKINQWSRRFNWQVEESIFAPEIINSCMNRKLLSRK